MFRKILCFFGWHDEKLENHLITEVIIHRKIPGGKIKLPPYEQLFWVCKHCKNEKRA